MRDAPDAGDPDGELSPEDRRELEALVTRLWHELHVHCVNVRIVDVDGRHAHDRHAGSGVLIRLPSGVYLGTAWHVVAEVYARRAAGGDAALVVGNAPLEPLQVAYKHATEGGDAVLLRVPEELLAHADGDPFEPPEWPPPPMRRGEVVFALGFPRVQHCAAGAVIETPGRLLAFSVEAIGAHHFAAVLEPERWVSSGERLSAADAIEFGGMSGGPAFAVRIVREGILYRLVGLVTDGGQSIDQAAGSAGSLTTMRAHALWDVHLG